MPMGSTRRTPMGVGWRGVGRVAVVGLALAGLGCSGVASAATALVVSPLTPGRLGYYALLAGARLPQVALLGQLGAALAAPAAAQRPAPLPSMPALRRLAVGGGRVAPVFARVAVVLGLVPLVVEVLVSAAVHRAAHVHGLTLGQPPGDTGDHARPELISFAAADGYRLTADLYRPGRPHRHAPAPGPAPAPGVIVVHGGAWWQGDKGENAAFSRWLAANGCLVLDVQYRLAPQPSWCTLVDDVCSALAWLRGQAEVLGVDPQRLVLLGRSAGGHLALLAARRAAPPPSGVIALYAPTDLRRLFDRVRRKPRSYVARGLVALLGGTPRAVPDAYRAASPITHVQPGWPRTLLIHGTLDAAVPLEHSQRLASALRQVGGPVELVQVPFARHAFDLVPDALASDLARQAVRRFLD